MISLIVPTQGNPKALKRTIESAMLICNEFIVGAMCLFYNDLLEMKEYSARIPEVKIIELPFNFVFLKGFSETLNTLASFSTNDTVIYLNVGEIIEKIPMENIHPQIDKYNSFYIDNFSEKHRWWRCYNRKQLSWSGLIHEEIGPEEDFIPYHKPLLTFADTEKDMGDPFKAKVKNDVKELVYWRQLIRIVDEPEVLGRTSIGWVQFAKDNYTSMRNRIIQKGKRWDYFMIGDYQSLMNDYYTNPEFEKERFQSNGIIEFQGDPKYLGKK